MSAVVAGQSVSRQEAERIISAVLADMADGSWFAAVGEPATGGEADEARLYLKGLDRPDCAIDWLADWDAARAATQRADWDHGWWDREQAMQRDLYAIAAGGLGEVDLLRHLTRITEAAARLLHGPAAVAAARAGVADAGLTRAAAGSAAQAAYQMSLARLGAASSEHPFAAKFRLFLAGRWPLTVAGGRFHVF